MTRPTKRQRSSQFSTLNPHAAGLDIGATFHVVAVAPDRDPEPVRTFRSFTGDLHHLADWLQAAGITSVAMESTGVYWIPVFDLGGSRLRGAPRERAGRQTGARSEDRRQ
jgi:transposase